MSPEQMEQQHIRLNIMLPTAIFIEIQVLQVRAESDTGEFCLKPRHIDYVTSLVPGILTYRNLQGEDNFVAIDGGVLVKVRGKVEIATRNAVAGELGELVDIVQQMQQEYDDREKASRSAAAKLEIGFLKQFSRLGSQ
ncbi:hypothetical protein [Desulfogranum japonicum]|uniref:hypothetical protein n=1 Tax=Desulfogranum japonicum TaxID=231447 RepID=UPI00041F7B29|nr:hypothetical protein [Desulfogranum japonicum]